MPEARTEHDLQQLLDAGVPEGRAVEYKEQLRVGTSEEKKEFLADVTSFANTSGGTIYFGIEEQGGIPTALVGIEITDADYELQRLENLMRDGIEPRMPGVAIQSIRLANERIVVAIEVPRSWALPHMVRSNGRFYARNSAGKYPLEVNELRGAFLANHALVERLHRFRLDRLSSIHAGESPLGPVDTGVIVIHLLPAEAFDRPTIYDLRNLDSSDLSPLPGGGSTRTNFDGLLSYLTEPIQRGIVTYLQAYRNGCIEAADELLLFGARSRRYIPSTNLEGQVSQLLARLLRFYRNLGIQPPVYVALSLLNVRGYILAVRDALHEGMGSPVDREVLIVPEIAVDDLGVDPLTVLRPAFDMVWNACGWEASLNYDENGNWRR